MNELIYETKAVYLILSQGITLSSNH